MLRKRVKLKKTFSVDINNPVCRYPGNPILTAEMVNKVWKKPELQTITVYNAGVSEYKGKLIMLFRARLRNGISIIGSAKSSDGIKWKINPKPALIPVNEDESGGVEDPRIIKIGNEYAVTYSAYHESKDAKVKASLAVTKDFKKFKRYGEMISKDAKNTVLFSEKINGKYIALFRIKDEKEDDIGGKFREIVIGYADDYKGKWDIGKVIIRAMPGPGAIAHKMGPGAPPIKTKYGWLNILHGVRKTMAGNPYVLGVALHDLKDPSKVKFSSFPILYPNVNDCKGCSYHHVPNVVFTCGAVRRKDGSIIIYYGADDTAICAAVTHENILKELCIKYGQDPLTGKLLYKL